MHTHKTHTHTYTEAYACTRGVCRNIKGELPKAKKLIFMIFLEDTDCIGPGRPASGGQAYLLPPRKHGQYKNPETRREIRFGCKQAARLQPHSTNIC